MGTKRVAVIGAGVSGIAAIKACLEEGLEPVAFEKEFDIGGIWHYTPDEDDCKRICTYDEVIMNSTRLTSIYSDFPNTNSSDPLYIGHKKFHEYLNRYVERFDLREYVEFGSEVIQVQNTEVMGRKWKVTWRKSGEADCKADYFDGVIVCNGRYNKPYVPDIPGLKEFKGKVIHSGHFRTSKAFENKRVLVIGIGNSGCELACQLGDVASEVLLSSSSGAWILPRVFPFNMPFESVVGSPFINSWMPTSLFIRLFEMYSRVSVDSDALGIAPDKPLHIMLPTACDDFKSKVAFGKVKLTGSVVRIDSTHGFFEDGSKHEIDAIVLGTGYELDYPFLEKNLLPYSSKGLPSSFMHMFPTEPSKEGLCYVGAVTIAAPATMLFELQARSCAAVLAGRVQLPTQGEMEKWVRDEFSGCDAVVPKGNAYFPPLSWFKVQEELANFLGVHPRPWRTLLTDFKLGKALLFSIPIASSFRLNGPHKWSGARQAIIQAGPDLKMAMSTLHRGKSYGGVFLMKLVKWLAVMGVAGATLLLVIGILLGKLVF